MTGARLPYLERRAGIWTLRVRVPDGVKLRVGLLEVRRSLRTHSAERACLLAATLVARLQEIFRMASTDMVTKVQVQALIERCFAGLQSETEGYALTFADPEYELHEQRRMIDERLTALRCQVASGTFDGEVQAVSNRLLAQHGWSALPPGLMRDLSEGVARALAEQQRLYEFRLTDRLMPYKPQDPFFKRSETATAAPPPPVPLPPTPVKVGPTAREAVDRYIKAKRQSWTRKTPIHRARQLNLFVEHVGEDRILRSVTKDDLRAFRDGLLRLRRNHHTGASLSFYGRQTEKVALQIAPKTALIHLQNVRTFLRWADREGYADTDPSAGLTVELPKKSKMEKSRRPLTVEELTTLFSAPMFTGCKSAKRRHEPGQVVVRDAQFWLPILGYYTGCRMGELVQLHLDDVHLDDPIPFIDITEKGGGEPGSGEEKHVKSAAGVRRVPIHSHLIDLGFADFVAQRRSRKGARKRLFFEIPFGKDEQASSPYSKRFARLHDKAGLTDKTICFHSFRHGIEDALRDIEKPQYVIDRVVGHAEGSTAAQYGLGVSLEVAAKAVAEMKLPVDVRSLVAA